MNLVFIYFLESKLNITLLLVKLLLELKIYESYSKRQLILILGKGKDNWNNILKNQKKTDVWGKGKDNLNYSLKQIINIIYYYIL